MHHRILRLGGNSPFSFDIADRLRGRMNLACMMDDFDDSDDSDDSEDLSIISHYVRRPIPRGHSTNVGQRLVVTSQGPVLNSKNQGPVFNLPCQGQSNTTQSQGRIVNTPSQALVQKNGSTSGSDATQKPSRRRNLTKYIQIGNTTLTLRSGNLAEQEAEVIVNSVANDLDLKKGAGSASLLKAGGDEIQQECWEKHPFGISNNEVVVTTGGKLRCSKIFHITIPPWKEDNEEDLKNALSNCLTLTEESKVTSIALPPLGHGFLKYPDSVIASTIVSVISDLEKSQVLKICKSVSIICHRSQHSVYKALKQEIQQLTVQLHIDMYKGGVKTPTYWTQYNHSKSLRDWNCHPLSEKCWEQVPVSGEEFTEIENLVNSTWIAQFVGHGRDSKGLMQLQYNTIEVTGIDRIENPLLAEKYGQTRAAMFHKIGKLERTFSQLEDIPRTERGHILTTGNRGTMLSRDMYPMVNEHYLFHGTTTDKIDVIAAQGFDSRMTQNAMFGAGVHTTESSTKADQYSDPKQQRDKDTPKKMILARILLGEMFVTRDVYSFQRPPCKTCKDDKCCDPSHNRQGTGFFDSVVVDGQWNFREFVVYNSSQCYPEYIITYKRV